MLSREEQALQFLEATFAEIVDGVIFTPPQDFFTIDVSEVQTHELEVTIYPGRTVEEWVTAGGYDRRDLGDEELFTTASIGRGLTVRKGATEPYTAAVVAFSGGSRMTTRDSVLAARASLSLDPIGLEHFFAVGEQHPDFQRGRRVAELDFWFFYRVPARHRRPNVFVVHDNRNMLLALIGNDKTRWIDKDLADGVFSADRWFLGLKREGSPAREQ